MCVHAHLSRVRAGGRRPSHQEAERGLRLLEGRSDAQHGGEASPSGARGCARPRAPVPLWVGPPPWTQARARPLSLSSPKQRPQTVGRSLHSPAPHFLRLTLIRPPRCVGSLPSAVSKLVWMCQSKQKAKMTLSLGKSICKERGQRIRLRNTPTAHTALCRKRKQRLQSRNEHI